MREIKFRAWDKYNKRWITNDVIFDLRNQEPSEAIINSSINNEDILLTQYTGLKDKNGKEIYEGDILKSVTLDEVHYEPVKFKDGRFYIEVVLPHNKERIIRSTIAHHAIDGKLLAHEVVGNIYENPELIK